MMQVGQKVTRYVGGVIPMELTISKIDDKYIWCGDWKFHKETFMEVDEDLDWDGVFRSGSVIQLTNSEN